MRSGMRDQPTFNMNGMISLMLASNTNSRFHSPRSRRQVVMQCLARVEVSGVVAPEAMKLWPTGRCKLEYQLTWRFARLAKGPASRMGGNCWSRGQIVSLLLLFAQVEFRPLLAPPISMNILSTRQRLMAIRVNTYCLQG